MQAVWVGTAVAAAAVDATVKPHLDVHRTISITSAATMCELNTELSVGNDSGLTYSCINSTLETQRARPDQRIPSEGDHLVAVFHDQRAYAASTVTQFVKTFGLPAWTFFPPAASVHCDKCSTRHQKDHTGKKPLPPVAQRSPPAVPNMGALQTAIKAIVGIMVLQQLAAAISV